MGRMAEYRHGAHSVIEIHLHLVWTTKYRKPVLVGAVGLRLRELIREICGAEDVLILKGHVSKDHVHLLVSIPPQVTISRLVQRLKERGHTIFLNSHLLGEVELICDRVAILQQGVLVREGTISELTRQKGRYEVGLAQGQQFPSDAVITLGYTVSPIADKPELVEVGCTADVLRAWVVEQDLGQRAADGETGHQVVARVTAAFQKIAGAHPGGTVAVVGHVASLTVALGRLCSLGSGVWGAPLPHAQPFLVEWGGQAWRCPTWPAVG